MAVIDAFELKKTYGERQVLAGLSLAIEDRERVGLVGSNGSGKSTLGRVLAGLDAPDGGRVSRRRGVRIDYLPQEPLLPAGSTVREYVALSLAAWSSARARYDDATAALGESAHSEGVDRLIAEQALAAEALHAEGGWERLHEADAVISHLGIDDASRLVETLSGGERRRAALARVLVGQPDLAILDEPTNHLDIETIEWLEEHLVARFRGALLLITHDRYLLDRVTDRTLEMNAGRIVSYAGGYVAYLEGKAMRQAHAERTESNRQNFLRRELVWLRTQPRARATKQKARLQRAQVALDQRKPTQERSADLRLEAVRQGRTILELSGFSLERDGRQLVAGLDLSLSAGQRLGVLGPNGSGKTSLLLTLLGELSPLQGTVKLGARTQIGYLDQARSELDADATVFEAVSDGRSTVELGGEEMQVGSYLERFLFSRAAQRVKVGELSGGERARVCLARLLCQKVNLLLLDEPTNDLDVDTLSALEGMLCDYTGSALIVSHDRWFLDRVATSILSFEGDGRVVEHAGNYSAYRDRKDASETRFEPTRATKSNDKSGTAGEEASPAQKRPAAARKLSFKEERELAGLFERIEAAEARVGELEEKLADPVTYRQEGAEIASLRQSLEEASAEAAALTERWEELEGKREAALAP